jgi:hypothetical protein
VAAPLEVVRLFPLIRDYLPFTPRKEHFAIRLVMSMKKLGGDIPTRRLMQATVRLRFLVARAAFLLS